MTAQRPRSRLGQNVQEVLRPGVEAVSDVAECGPHVDRPLVAVWTQNTETNRPPALLIMREHPSGSTRSMILFRNEVQDLIDWLATPG